MNAWMLIYCLNQGCVRTGFYLKSPPVLSPDFQGFYTQEELQELVKSGHASILSEVGMDPTVHGSR